MRGAARKVIFAFVVATASGENREVANRIPKLGRHMAADARGGAKFAREVTGNVVAHSDDELATALLRNTELPGFLHLRLDAVAERAGLGLNAR
jgi:hypothetical protein